MPVSLPLTDDEVEALTKATKGKVEVTLNGRTLTLTRDTIIPIRQALHRMHQKKVAIKTKSIDNVEFCYYAQRVIGKLDKAAGEFGPLPEADNDDTTGIVSEPIIEDVVTEEEVVEQTLAPEENNDDADDK